MPGHFHIYANGLPAKWQAFKGTVYVFEKMLGIKTLPNHTVLMKKKYKVLLREEEVNSELSSARWHKVHKIKNMELPKDINQSMNKITEAIEALSDEVPSNLEYRGTDRTLNSKSNGDDSADVRKYHQDSQGNMYRSDSEVKGQLISAKTHKTFKGGIESTFSKKNLQCLDKEQKLKESTSDGNLHNASGKTGEKVPLESQNLFRKIHYMSQNRESLDNMAGDEQGIMEFADRSQLNQVGISEVMFGGLPNRAHYSKMLEYKPKFPKGEGPELVG